MAQGQEVDGGCANRVWRAMAARVGGGNQVWCMHAQKIEMLIKFDEKT